jgi:hypothetical protein
VASRLIERKPELARSARTGLLTALKLWKAVKPGDVGDERRAELAAAATRATVLAADALLEDFLAFGMPAGLDPSRPAAQKQFVKWLTAKHRLLDSALASYQAALTMAGDNEQTLAVYGRIGQLYQAFVSALEDAPLPSGMTRQSDAGQAFCAAIAQPVEPLAAKAIDAFQRCLDAGAKLGVRSEWFDRCETGLAMLAPRSHPALREIWPEPELGPIISLVPPQ